MKQLQIKIPVFRYDPAELPDELIRLKEAAFNACQQAYAPYSHFLVGAAAWLENGAIVTGSNQENAAYPSGLCAERVALFSANHQYPGVAIKTLAIAAINQGIAVREITPCGACRQVLLESEKRQQQPIQVLLCGSESVYSLKNASSLLPLAFDNDAFSTV